ncbi:MAG TPA: response regulator [Nitrososphaeraceae archaeon]|nr:response regulator [Nitrososphaeraceae archaeon]
MKRGIVYTRQLGVRLYGKEIKKRLKIIIVEDEEDILTLYSDYLSNKGYHVIARYTRGNNIKTDLQRHSPDVYLIDFRLPGKKADGGSHRILGCISVRTHTVHCWSLPST